ncbi:hypothetical protein HXX76_012871 [Chlamydomonas incerta]|uniref:Fungal lipase-type domain-containing protein n=1 Tax=Chlamydomonas incerta TaxID=51695 RepID=A0A835SGZ8_CHLIN|nr:hypothetical protein HXX76_012871 [Chlamydomonas incerta]|eukprot:KAG2426819.1 hypothetical protein HXX76_012871 [Chlamydomonas incerta]
MAPRTALQLGAASAALVVMLAVAPAAVSATWVPNPSCVAGSTCTSANTCLSATAVNSSTPCGTGFMQVAYTTVYNSCYWTSCWYGGCPSGYVETDSWYCGIAFQEYCCKEAAVYTCRQTLNCIAYPDPPSPRPPSPFPPSPPPSPPPPPPPSNWAAFANGAWVGSATTNSSAMAYVAGILARSMYVGRMGFSSDPGALAFGAAYHSRIVARLGGIATTVQYWQQSTEVALVETPTSFILVTRGSEQATDWFSTNLNIGWTYTTIFGPGVYVWTGFANALTVNEQALRNLVATTYAAGTTQPRKPLWFAGHSLGGGMSFLFAHYVRARMNIVPQGIYTFGAPNVGYSDWAAAYQPLLASRTYLNEADGDAVVGQPPWPYNDADTPGTRTALTACPNAAAYNAAIAAGHRRSALTGAAAGLTAAEYAAGAEQVFRGGPLDSAATSSGRKLLAKAPPPRRSSATTTTTLPVVTQPDAEDLGSLDALGSADADSTTTTDTTGSSTSDDAVQTRGDLLGIDQHDIQASYMTDLYYCVLSDAAKAKVPLVGEVNVW